MDRLVFDIGEFRIDGNQRRLIDRAGEPVALTARAFDVLIFMVQRPGELLDKATLMQAVWPDTVVEENNLTQCIFTLRRALGESAGEHRYIVTVPGRGYQFVAKVRREAEASPPPEPVLPVEVASRSPKLTAVVIAAALLAILGYLFWPSRDPSRTIAAGDFTPAPLKSIAILPFTDLTPEKDMEYFGDGLAEELMSALGKLRGLQVVGRRSAFTFKNKNEDVRKIGSALDAESVLEGSVRREGERIRIVAQLSRTSDGYSLWTETYDRKLDDVIDVQGAIAKEVARALNPIFAAEQTIASRVHTQNPEAYASYLRGVFFFGKLDLAHAREEFLRATQLDPQFAMAFAQLARCYDYETYGGGEDTAVFRAQADKAIAQALKLDPSLDVVWWIYALRNRKGMGGRAITALLERAVEANSSDADAMLDLSRTYALFGRRDESLAMLERAYQADPMWSGTIYALAYFNYSFKGDRERFLELANALERLDPASAGPLYMRSDLAFFEGRPLDWDRYLAKTVERAPRDSDTHAYVAKEYADIRLDDAANYHYDLAMKLTTLSPYVARTLAHIRLISAGDISAAKRIVDEVMRRQPEDIFALRAQAELQYFEGDCAGSLESLARSDPSIESAEAMDVVGDAIIDWEVTPWLLWCLGKQGNLARQAEIARAWDIAARPPTTPDLAAYRARTFAARGDRTSLIEELKRLIATKAPVPPFSRFEPIAQPYLKDPDVAPLLAVLEARCTEWHRVLPKSSMKVPIPDAPAKDPAEIRQ